MTGYCVSFTVCVLTVVVGREVGGCSDVDLLAEVGRAEAILCVTSVASFGLSWLKRKTAGLITCVYNDYASGTRTRVDAVLGATKHCTPEMTSV